MAETIRLNKVLRELNISLDRAVEFLDSKGVEIEKRPTTKISEETYSLLSGEFETDANKKVKSQEVSEAKLKEKEDLRIKREKELEAKHKAQEAREKARQQEIVKASAELSGPKTVGKIDLDSKKKAEEKPAESNKAVAEEVEKVAKEEVVKAETPKVEEIPVTKSKKTEPEEKPQKEVLNDEGEVVPDEKVTTQYKKLTGPKIAGDKIDLSKFNKPKKKKEEKKPAAKAGAASKTKRRRISKAGAPPSTKGGARTGGNDSRFRGKLGQARRNAPKEEPSEEDVKKQVRETLEKLQGK